MNNNDYLSKPAKSNGMGIVLVHEFWGVNEQINKMADRFAVEGFTVLAVDLYKGVVAKDIDDARKMKDAVTDEHALGKVREGILKLEKESVPANKIAVLGFCFGGSVAFKSAVANLSAGAYVIFYGSMITDDRSVLEKIQKPVLGIFGGADPSIPTLKVESMKKMLDILGKTNEIYIYPSAVHAFMNDERDSYNADATKDAWVKTLAFLTKYLVHV